MAKTRDNNKPATTIITGNTTTCRERGERLVEIISGMTAEWTVDIIHLPAKYKQDAPLQTGRAGLSTQDRGDEDLTYLLSDSTRHGWLDWSSLPSK